MNEIPVWGWILIGGVVWIAVGALLGMWVGNVLRRRRKLQEFVDWCKHKDETRAKGGLVVEVGDGSIRISTKDDEHEIPIKPGSDVSLKFGESRVDPDEPVH